MRCFPLIALILIATAAPSEAELTTHYRGVERKSSKEVPATAQFSIEPGRVAMVMKGSHDCRMLFLEKEGVLRFVDDGEKTYIDMTDSWVEWARAGESAAAGMAAEIAELPPEQRETAKAMMEQFGSTDSASATKYVWTKEKAKVLQYDCTKVEIMRSKEKRGEYWGTASKDFQLSEPEHKTMLAMQEYLHYFTIQAVPAAAGEAARALGWDMSVDGFPLITRCFEKGTMTLDLRAESFDRKALSKELFEIPSDYKEFSTPVPGE